VAAAMTQCHSSLRLGKHPGRGTPDSLLQFALWHDSQFLLSVDMQKRRNLNRRAVRWPVKVMIFGGSP
jgi:hypothetical protein